MSAYVSKSSRRRGLVAVQVAVVISVLLGAAALTIDVGHIYNARLDMQSAVDASALAGASGLLDSQGAVISRALHFASENFVANDRVKPEETVMTIGFWEGTQGRFYPATGAELVEPNAVRVRGARKGLSLFFAPILGVRTTNIERVATAVYGAGRCAGIWGLDGITGDGDIWTDSYDSSKSAYGAGNIRANGDICSNRDIDLYGGVQIYGDAMYGPGYDLTTAGSSYEIWGSVDEHCCVEEVPYFDMATAAITNDNAMIGLTERGRDPYGGTEWDLAVSGNDNLTIAGGTFYATSVLIEGQATITVTGPTTLYVSGLANFTGGGIINATQDPKNLTIYVGAGPTVVSGNAGFYGALIAPESTVHLVGTSDLYGMIMAGILDVDGNAMIHVDESLIPMHFGGTTESLVLVQ